MIHPIRAEKVHRHLPCWVTGRDFVHGREVTIWGTHTRPSSGGEVVIVGPDWNDRMAAIVDGRLPTDFMPCVLILDPNDWVHVADSRVHDGWQALLEAIRELDDKHNGDD